MKITNIRQSFLESPSNRPEPKWILSMCLERSSLLLNMDSQYGHRADSLDITKIVYNRFIKLVNILTIESSPYNTPMKNLIKFMIILSN